MSILKRRPLKDRLELSGNGDAWPWFEQALPFLETLYWIAQDDRTVLQNGERERLLKLIEQGKADS